MQSFGVSPQGEATDSKKANTELTAVGEIPKNALGSPEYLETLIRLLLDRKTRFSACRGEIVVFQHYEGPFWALFQVQKDPYSPLAEFIFFREFFFQFSQGIWKV